MKRITMLVATGTVTLALAACGGGSDADTAAPQMTMTTSPSTAASAPTPTPTVSTKFNDTDVTFAQMMIPHHRQAIDMAKLVDGRATNPEVTKLAAAIRAAQDPEIQTMATWLTAWGKDVPTGSMPGMDHGSHGMPGMMSEADMAKLKTLSGPAFDKQWLTMMISHHEGAVRMAEGEQVSGENPEAVALAKKIEADQKVEIATMRGLLGPA